MDKHMGDGGRLGPGSPSLTCIIIINLRCESNVGTRQENLIVLILAEQISDLSVIIITTTTTVLSGLTVCQMYGLLVSSQPWRQPSPVGTITVPIFLMRNLKLGEVK